MDSNLGRDKSVITNPESKKLKIDAKLCRDPVMARLLEDPKFKEIAEQTLNDPAYNELQKQWRHLIHPSSQFDAEAYSSAVQQVLNNPQLLANAKRFKKALSKDPSRTEAQKARIKDAIPCNATEYEIGSGFFGARLRKLADRDTFQKVHKAMFGDDIMPYDKSSFHHMAMVGDAEGLKNALESGVDVNKLDSVKRSALHVACAYGKAECAQILINNEVDLNAVDDNENTALHYAAGHGMVNCVQLLLNSGADKELKNCKGHTYIELPPIRNDSTVLKLLE